jgi:hypothetical protein
LAIIHEAVLEYVRGRDDVVLFGAQAVNAYVAEPRMTQDIDLLSIRAEGLAQDLRTYLSQRFQIAVRVREVSDGRGYRLYQVQKSGNRHLVDLRPVDKMPSALRIEGVLIIAPVELIASKVIGYRQRRGKPKSGTDWRDLAMLLLTFPELKQMSGAVADHLNSLGADSETMSVWQELVKLDIQPEDEDDEF